MTCVAQVENNERAAAVLARHWPDVPGYGDVRDVGRHNLPDADVLCGGFPCQDVSIAGRRAGLAGERSGLWFEFLRILTELKTRTVVIENVPGLLSSNSGEDFAVILRGLVECGYRVAWRVLDAQYFGVAQRRRRVFIVGSLGDGRCAEILFEREGGTGHSEPGGTAREGLASPITASAPGRRNGGSSPTEDAFVLARMRGFGDYQMDGKAGILKARDGKDATDLVVGTLSASGAGTARTGNARNEADMLIAVDAGSGDDISPTLSSDGHDGSEDGRGRKAFAIAWGIGSHAGAANADVSNKAHASGGAVGFGIQEEQANTLRGGRTGAIAFNWNSRALAEGEISPTIRTGHHNHPAIQSQHLGVRRLTPTECERLQGFPDGWTAGQSDSARYRQLGNAVCVNVAAWVGQRVLQAAR